MTRQKLSIPRAVLPPPPSQAKRNRNWETNQQTASYRIPTELRDRITSIAKEELITTSELVRYLLEYGLDAYAANKLSIQPVLRTGKYTLYPGKTQ